MVDRTLKLMRIKYYYGQIYRSLAKSDILLSLPIVGVGGSLVDGHGDRVAGILLTDGGNAMKKTESLLVVVVDQPVGWWGII
ncbi:hypothetical protein FXO38_28156 [Capsicum annuum]|nr:hypothetical protein FXO38_28156 [Capsicum annuum]